MTHRTKRVYVPKRSRAPSAVLTGRIRMGNVFRLAGAAGLAVPGGECLAFPSGVIAHGCNCAGRDSETGGANGAEVLGAASPPRRPRGLVRSEGGSRADNVCPADAAS